MGAPRPARFALTPNRCGKAGLLPSMAHVRRRAGAARFRAVSRALTLRALCGAGVVALYAGDTSRTTRLEGNAHDDRDHGRSPVRDPGSNGAPNNGLIELYLRLDPVARRRVFLTNRDAARDIGVGAANVADPDCPSARLAAVRVGRPLPGARPQSRQPRPPRRRRVSSRPRLAGDRDWRSFLPRSPAPFRSC